MFAAPTGDRLDAAERPAFRALLTELDRLKFDQTAIEARMAEFVAVMTTMCATDGAQQRMVEELDAWVRWHRLPGYFLSYIFQAAMAQQRSLTFVAACILFSDAQMHFAEDLSLDSLENAYTTLISVAASGGDISAIGDDLSARMHAVFQYYRAWYSAVPSETVNPLAENLYFNKAWRDLRTVFPELTPSVADVDVPVLERIVARCGEPADAYCRVVALRVLGLRYGGSGDIGAARAAFERAIADARAVGLDAEVGHLHRFLGHALQRAGEYEKADLQCRLAFTWDNHPKLRFYQALALSELGDVRARNLPPSVDPANVPPGWNDALQAYAAGRDLFEGQVARNVLPIGRAVQQQMFRSYADNGIQVALPVGPKDVLAAIEAFGPRSATDIVAESRAAGMLDAPKYERYRSARAVFHADLATRDDSVDGAAAFERYRQNVIAHHDERRFYTRTRKELAGSLANAQRSGAVAERVAALRLASTVFLVFHVGASRTHVLLVDASTGTTPFSAFVDMPEPQWKAAHDAYRDAAARSKKKERPAAAMRRALDGLTSFYQATFGGLFEMLLPVIAGKHVKIFPRSYMNEMPFQALRVGGRLLIDICDVSYAPSLSLWLQIHEPDAAPFAGSLSVLHDAARTPLYVGTLRAIAQRGEPAAVVTDGSWNGFRTALARRPSTDVLFACHGSFYADNPRKSCLFVTKDEPVGFNRFFADLDLRGYRSVVMGACESGVGRTLVTAEYIGLPLALLAAGVQYAIGALWQVNTLASAILVADFYRLLHGEARAVVRAWNEAARRLSAMTKNDVKAWTQTYLADGAARYASEIDAMDEMPFVHPYYWAGYGVSGDV